MKKSMLIIIIGTIFICNLGVSAKEVVGEIVAVNQDQDIVLIKDSSAKVTEYKLSVNTKIYLNDNKVTLNALRPITTDAFQYAKIRVADLNQVESIHSYYKVINVKIRDITKDTIVLENLNSKEILESKINQGVEFIRNNFVIKAANLMKGDSGIAILGVDNKLKKVILYHYEISGIIASVDCDKRIVKINIGTRLKPILKNYLLQKNSKIISARGVVEIKKLVDYNWIKLEENKGINRIIVRKI